MGIQFLSVVDVTEIHRRQIEAHGGMLGVRDQGLLEAAIATPQAAFGGQYLHPTLPEMAAAYLFHLCKNHPFLDGNKRVAALSSMMFLFANGVTPPLTNEELVKLTLGVATGETTKAELSELLRVKIG